MLSSLTGILVGGSIRGRVVRFLLLVGLVPLLSVVVYLTLWQRGVLEDSANDNLASQAQLQASTVERALSGAATHIQSLSENPILQSPTASRQETLGEMLKAQEFSGAFEDVTLVDTQGQVIDSTTYLFSGTWSDKAWYAEALAGTPSVSEAHLIASPRRLVVVFTAPVMTDGQVSAVIAGQMNMELVWEVLDSVRIGDTGFMMAIDRNGNLVSHPDKDLLLTKLAGSVTTEGSATAAIDFTGSDQGLVGQAAPMSGLGWHVLAVQDRDETYAVVDDIARTVAIVLIIVLLLTAGATLFFSRIVGRAERSLRFTQFSVDQSADSAFWTTSDGHIFYVNDAACRSLGYSHEELLSMTVFDIDGDLVPEAWPEQWQRLVELGTSTIESRHRARDGRIFPVEITASYLEFGGRGYNCCFARDITERKQAEEALRESEHFLLESQSVAQIGSYVLDIPSGVWQSSPVLNRIFGIGEDYERSAESWLALVHPDVRQSMADYFAHDVVEERCRFDREYRIVRHDDGTERWVLGLGELEFDAQGQPQRMIGTIQDITERKRAEDELQKYSLLVENSNDFIAIASLDGKVQFVNKAGRELVGLDADEDVGSKAIAEFLTEEGFRASQDVEIPAVQAHGSWSGETTLRHFRTGSAIPVLVNSFLINDSETGAPLGLATVQRDITERKQAEETIRHLAFHDGLTNLPNRTLFIDRFKVALTRARRTGQMTAVIFLDLDRFKTVNDTVGHTFGNQLLRDVGERLTRLVREGDTVARMGGDEFTLLLPDIERTEDVFEVAERIIATFRRPWLMGGHEFSVTASLGIATYPDDGDDAESLLRKADTAMYRAKDEGRDTYRLYTEAMNVRIAERVALESSLRHGLERGEFVVHYQPQVDISSRRIVGTEALVRWQHPERGLVSPIEFIPVAEETGLIVPLGTWVLKTACAQNAAWQQAGHAPMPVAVNLSARQFQQRDLLDTVTQVLEESGMDPQYLQFEITEGVAMQDTGYTVTTLRALREKGVQIAIDDFGTGYSSLSYLKSFPVSALKIDRSFVRDLTVDPNDAAITAAILAMAKSLRIKVIAEGVETEEQLAFLKEHGCDEMQGFLFSKPVTARALEKILARGSRPKALARRPD